MKTRTFVAILILVLAVLFIMGNCATTPPTQEEREDVNQEIFFQSVVSGDTIEVKRLIDEGINVSAQDNEGFTAIYTAVHYEYTEIVRILIEAGADVNARTYRGNRALMDASRGGHTEIAKLLIDAGAEE